MKIASYVFQPSQSHEEITLKTEIKPGQSQEPLMLCQDQDKLGTTQFKERRMLGKY